MIRKRATSTSDQKKETQKELLYCCTKFRIKVTTITVFLLITDTYFLLFTLSTWKSPIVEPWVPRTKQNINLELFLQSLRLYIDT